MTYSIFKLNPPSVPIYPPLASITLIQPSAGAERLIDPISLTCTSLSTNSISLRVVSGETFTGGGCPFLSHPDCVWQSATSGQLVSNLESASACCELIREWGGHHGPLPGGCRESPVARTLQSTEVWTGHCPAGCILSSGDSWLLTLHASICSYTHFLVLSLPG